MSLPTRLLARLAAAPLALALIFSFTATPAGAQGGIGGAGGDGGQGGGRDGHDRGDDGNAGGIGGGAGGLGNDPIGFPLVAEILIDAGAPVTAAPGDRDVFAGHFQVMATGQVPLVLRGITLVNSGTGYQQSDITRVSIYHDRHFNGPDASDPLLADDPWETPEAYIPVPEVQLLPQGHGFAFFVRVDFADTAIDGAEFQVAIGDLTFQAGAVQMGTELPAGGTPITIAHHLIGTVTVSSMPMAAAGAPLPGDSAVPVLAMHVATHGLPVTLTSISLTALGDGNDATAIQRVELVRDRNQNGRVDGVGLEGGDELVDHGPFFTDDGTVTLVMDTPIAPGGAARLLVALTFADSAQPGTSFGIRVETIGVTGATELSGLPLVSQALVIGEPGEATGEGGDDPAGAPVIEPLADASELSLIGATAGCSAGGVTGTPAWLLPGALLLLVARRRAG